jgi:hypothetical protein
MHGKWFAAGALATAGMLAFALPVRAGDTHRLSMPSRTAGGYGGGHGGYGGGRGGYGYGHGGYGHGGYGYGRSYYGGYGRGYGGGYGYNRGYGYGRGYYGGYGYGRGYYGGYGRGYYGGYGYYPSYSYGSYYQPYYYSTPSVYYYSTPSYSVDPFLYPSGGASSRVLSLSIAVAPTTRRRIVEIVAAPAPVQPDDQTYPYDGGPRNPAPMPKAEPTSPDALPSAAPVDDHSVSLPAKIASKLVYPAYGEQTTLPGAPRFSERGVLVKGDPARKLAK